MSERTGLSGSQVTDEVLYAGLVGMQDLPELYECGGSADMTRGVHWIEHQSVNHAQQKYIQIYLNIINPLKINYKIMILLNFLSMKVNSVIDECDE